MTCQHDGARPAQRWATGPVGMDLRFWGPTPPGRGKWGTLVKNIDIVRFQMGPTFPIWSGPITSFPHAWMGALYI